MARLFFCLLAPPPWGGIILREINRLLDGGAMRFSGKVIVLITGLAGPAGWTNADPWPAWRGPTGQGHSAETGLPVKWGPAENLRWKVPLAHPGNSTPVIWGDRVYLTEANKGGTVRGLICLHREDGRVLWKREITFAKKERNWNENWYCNASPATDGERVFVSHGSAGLFCYDTAGNEIWRRTDLGHWEHPFGSGASPVLHEGTVILWCGPHEAPVSGSEAGKANSLMGMDKKTGKTVWEHAESFGSWCTPLIAKVDGRDQLVLGQSRDAKGAVLEKTGFLKGLDPRTGRELWQCRGLDSYVYASPLVAGGIAVGMSGYGGSALAVRLGGAGDISGDRLWLHPKNPQRVGSGVVAEGHLYMVDESGPPRCFELSSGEEKWKAERPTKAVTWGSMVHADGKLMVLMRDGETLVLSAKPTFEILARNKLGAGEETNSSIAISDGAIYVRTFRNLWCFGAPVRAQR